MDHNGSHDEVNAHFGNDEEMGEIPQVEVPLKTVYVDLIKTSSDGGKIRVEFNKFGVAIGQWSTKMASRTGVLVRHHLPLSFNDWRLVPSEYKDNIWNEINVSFYNFLFYI